MSDSIEAKDDARLRAELAASEASCDRLRDAYDQIRVLNVEIGTKAANELAAARQDAERMHPFAQWFAQIPLWRDTYSDGPDILDTSAPINELVKAEQVREARAAIQGATGAQ